MSNRSPVFSRPTGIAPLDKVTRGLKPGEMITIGAPTKGGKSALALNIAMHNGLLGIPVGVFSLEMNADELTDRLIAAHGSVDPVCDHGWWIQ